MSEINKLDNLRYGGEDKEAFLSSISKDMQMRAGRFFKHIAKREKLADKDVTEMSRNEVANAVSQMGFYNRHSLKITLTGFNSYLRWRMANNKPIHDDWMAQSSLHVNEIDLLPSMKEKCIASAEDLVKRLSEKMKLDEGRLAPPAAVLAWMGFSLSESADIRNEDVDLTAKTIRGVAIPPELFNIIKAYYMDDNIKEFWRDTGTGSQRKMFMTNNGYFLKKVAASSTKTRIKTVNITEALQVIDLPAKDIEASGRYHRMRILEDQRKLTNEDIIRIWAISENRTNMKEAISDRVEEYKIYRKAFP